MGKRIIWMCAVLSACFLWVHLQMPANAAEPAKTHAQAAALIDVASGRILYSQQGDKRMRIASLTKIMTAIVAIEQGKLSDKVTVSRNSFGKEGSSIYLKLGEEISLDTLLYGLMLRSGNDAATAIAEQVGGSVEGFAVLMNEKAEQIGMHGSHFSNPSGLDAKDHYSTANDMAKLTAYALNHPVFRQVVKTRVKKVQREDESWMTVWTNKNKMLSLFPGGDGVKTGYTKLAGRCLVSSATRDRQQLAVVTLNDGDDWADHGKLLSYGFKEFPLKRLIGHGDPVDNDLAAGRTLSYPLNGKEESGLARKVETEPQGSLKYRLGLRGVARFYLAETIIGSVPLYEPGSPLLRQETGDLADSVQGITAAGSGKYLVSCFCRVVRTLFMGGTSW